MGKHYKKREYKVNYHKEDFTKCWTCKKACGGCIWSQSFKPVPGWTAEKTFIPSNGEMAASYHIIECPEYMEG